MTLYIKLVEVWLESSFGLVDVRNEAGLQEELLLLNFQECSISCCMVKAWVYWPNALVC